MGRMTRAINRLNTTKMIPGQEPYRKEFDEAIANLKISEILTNEGITIEDIGQMCKNAGYDRASRAIEGILKLKEVSGNGCR